MSKVIPFQWQRIGSLDEDTYRAKVIGGWLVSDNHGICFVPDPKHQWEVR